VPGHTFAQRSDAAILSGFQVTGIRLAGIRCDPDDPGRSDLALHRREIKVRGKGGKNRIVSIDHEAARRIDRYLRGRARHEQAHRPGLCLGTDDRAHQLVEGDQARSPSTADPSR
jgi:site-specific recombinase XerC